MTKVLEAGVQNSKFINKAKFFGVSHICVLDDVLNPANNIRWRNIWFLWTQVAVFILKINKKSIKLNSLQKM